MFVSFLVFIDLFCFMALANECLSVCGRGMYMYMLT